MQKYLRIIFIISSLLLFCVSCATGLKPWSFYSKSTDIVKSHTETVSTDRHEYKIVMGGTVDGENSRSPIGYKAWEQTWESNRSIRLENIGETDVINPWLSNGKNNLSTIEEIVNNVLEPGMTEEEKAIAIWRWSMQHRFHATTGDAEMLDPVKVFNVYGYMLCDDDAIVLACLWREGGLKVRPAYPWGHAVNEVFFSNKWHLMDGDENIIFLLRDNSTIAGESDIVQDHDLIKRTHTYGILQNDDRQMDEFSASLYWYTGDPGVKPPGVRECVTNHNMKMILRPGESIVWRWGYKGSPKFHGKEWESVWGKNSFNRRYNGLWEYKIDFSKDIWRKGAYSFQNIEVGEKSVIAEPGKVGTIIWKINSPYVFVGGRLEIEGKGAKYFLSWDGKEWEDIEDNFDMSFPQNGPARYQYYLKCQLKGKANIKHLTIVNDIQMAPLSLPGMSLGENKFIYSDETQGKRKVAITHEWVERSSSRPPLAPPEPVSPQDGMEVEGTKLTFKWQIPSDPDGDDIVDYHFELSDRSDIKWPLSPNFEKLISKTSDKGKAEYTLPYTGLLNSDTEYYWRVRAKDENGIWGLWSKIWKFIPQGPAPPVNVKIEFDPVNQIGVLKWEPNKTGRKPVKYRIYGSNEKGFTISDELYMVYIGYTSPIKMETFLPPTPFMETKVSEQTDENEDNTFYENLQYQFPANFFAETENTEFTVIGEDITIQNANKAFYRVVAVDEYGNQSGSSDAATVNSPYADVVPVIYSKPVVNVKKGKKYSYRIKLILSMGDLTCKSRDRYYDARFWTVEWFDANHPIFSLKQSPKWLSIDKNTGVLSGIPESAAKHEVIVIVNIPGYGELIQDFVINVID